jgi:ornithine cyclodeaminase/alanine dehydrogenase-like protein (mu-crystallin family)
VEGADVVCVTTHAHEPLLRRAWLAPGAHVVTVAYYGDLEPAVVEDAALFVETAARVLEPYPVGAMDLAELAAAGRIGPEHIRAELGQLLAGTARGRERDDELTLFRSIGSAVEDAAIAAVALEAWRARRAPATR